MFHKKIVNNVVEIFSSFLEVQSLLNMCDYDEKTLPTIVQDEIKKIAIKENIYLNDSFIREYKKSLINKYSSLIQKRRKKIENIRDNLEIILADYCS